MQEPEDKLNIHVTTKQDGARIAVDNFTAQERKVYGLDCEWDVRFVRGNTPRPDVLQIATPDGYCVLFKLNSMSSFPRRLKEFLENPLYLKVGVGVQEDVEKLKAAYKVDAQGVLDVRYVADEVGVDPRGLSSLSESVLGVEMKKYHYKDKIHRWSGFLSDEQKRYAATDAVNGVRIFNKLNHKQICNCYGDQWSSWSNEEYQKITLDHWREYLGKPFEYMRSKYHIGRIVDMMLNMSCLGCDTKDFYDNLENN